MAVARRNGLDECAHGAMEIRVRMGTKLQVFGVSIAMAPDVLAAKGRQTRHLQQAWFASWISAQFNVRRAFAPDREICGPILHMTASDQTIFTH
jgi:hypothetical protein